MRRQNHCYSILPAVLVLVASNALVSGCASDSYAAKGAGEGAATGALAGAVGGMATALIFGGDVGEAAARGAVYGGASGAVVGGVAGSKADDRAAAQKSADQDRELAKFKEEIGTDAFNGFVALAECKYEVALANAREAQRSNNRDFALAGVWVEALTEADRNNQEAASALFPELVSRDRDIADEASAADRLTITLDKLGDVRADHDLPTKCS